MAGEAVGELGLAAVCSGGLWLGAQRAGSSAAAAGGMGRMPIGALQAACKRPVAFRVVFIRLAHGSEWCHAAHRALEAPQESCLPFQRPVPVSSPDLRSYSIAKGALVVQLAVG